MSDLRLYFRYLRMHARSQVQYSGWWIKVLVVAFIVITDPLEIVLLFDRFGAVGEWEPSRVLLMYGMAICSFGMAETFGRGFDYFPQLIRSGDFDRLLLRPRPLFLQTAAARFHLHRIARVVSGLVIIELALRAQSAPRSAADLLMLAAALAGGTLLYIGVFLLIAALTFFTIADLHFAYIFTNGSYQVAKVPPQYLPDWLRRTFLYVVPMLAFCYLPAGAVCGWGVTRLAGWTALPAGAAFLAAAHAVWLLCSRHYHSTGS